MAADILSTIVGLIALTMLMGPAGSVPFALARGMSTSQTALAVSAIHAALVPLLFGFFEVIEYSRRYQNRLIARMLTYAMDKSREFRSVAGTYAVEFERRVGQAGFGLCLIGFSFLFGNIWASLAAYILNLKKATVILSIAIGAVVSSVFWTLVFVGVVGFLPSPWIWYAVITAATLIFLAYKKIRERRLLPKILGAFLRKVRK